MKQHAGPHINRLGARDCSRVRQLADAAGLRLEPERELEKQHSECWVARLGADIGAFLCAHRLGDEYELLDLVTAPEARRRGLARALVATLLGRAAATGATAVFLEVRASNQPAQNLYRAAGFVALGVRRAYYGDGEDALQMVYRFCAPR